MFVMMSMEMLLGIINFDIVKQQHSLFYDMYLWKYVIFCIRKLMVEENRQLKKDDHVFKVDDNLNCYAEKINICWY